MVKVVASSSLPIDLVAQVMDALPGTEVLVPGSGHHGFGNVNLADADALVSLLLDPIDAALLARAPRLRIVANCAVGVDNIAIEAATAAGVAVTNTPDVLTEATAELTFALLLAAARRLGEADRLVRSGTWGGWALDQLLGVQLAGATLGIVGLGRIGRAVAQRAVAFGMRVIYASSSASSSASRLDVAATRVGLDELFATADVVSLHCPATPATTGLVNAARLATMKRRAILVNTARGACVDEVALAEALERGALFAAALDVFTHEPAIEPRLLASPRAVLAPHIGSATTQARTQMAQLCADAVIAMLSGRRPAHLVNPSVWASGSRAQERGA